MKMRHTLLLLALLVPGFTATAANTSHCQRLVTATLPDSGAKEPEGFFREAEQAYRDCSDAGLSPDIRARALLKYATAREIRGSIQAAIDAYGQAITVLERAPGRDTPLLVEILDRAVYAESTAGLRAAAIGHASRALALRRAEYGTDSRAEVTGLVNLGVVHATFGDYAAAERIISDAITTARKLCTLRCESLAEAYAGMYALYMAQGNEAEARRYDEMVLSATPLPDSR